jgi:AcrR family transcriptional regulator
MSPRAYRGDRRREAAKETGARILAGARELLVTGDGMASFTVDAVARQADVARMTVYHQFGSKNGLLEALFDDLVERGQVERDPSVNGEDDAREALDRFIAAAGRFWATDRVIIRRLHAVATLDSDFERVLRVRDERRRDGIRAIVRRLEAVYGLPEGTGVEDGVDILYALTSTESFDHLAGSTRTLDDVIPLVQRIVAAALGLQLR